MIIIGIDPGSTRIGFGLLKTNGRNLVHLKSGLLDIPKGTKSLRLLFLGKGLEKIIAKFKPDRAGLEKLFFVKNKKTALEVAEARGVIINTLIKRGVKLFEFAPSEVKLAVTGNGNADKQAVAKMVSLILCLSHKPKIDDVSDALAIAITASQHKVLK
ncbi:MAG: crossover junction endodeoxyribonuclease RuvC [Patescibacteria group bacterium]|nr:crossover junction endodeoxyribonuclease RuvC [Patescibacteria group bacterium]